MTIQIHTDISKLKPRLIEIYRKYKSNFYYADNPKMFAFLVMLIEDYPDSYLNKINTDVQQILIKKWIEQLFQLENVDIAKKLSTADKIQLILNNVVELPQCKCKTKLRSLQHINS